MQQVVGGGSSNSGVIQSYVGPLAESKPFIMCPSAMLCVPKANCDFKGVITERNLPSNPQLDMLRVPLIVSCKQTADFCDMY